MSGFITLPFLLNCLFNYQVYSLMWDAMPCQRSMLDVMMHECFPNLNIDTYTNEIKFIKLNSPTLLILTFEKSVDLQLIF